MPPVCFFVQREPEIRDAFGGVEPSALFALIILAANQFPL
jgi:hypothetical protein